MHTGPAPDIPARRSELEQRQDRLTAIDAWHMDYMTRRASLEVADASREARMAARRRLDALKRAQAALVARSEQTAAASRDALARRPQARAVVVHRSEWLRDKLTLGLADGGVAVVAAVDDGADGLGITIAEQPDLVVVEDRLPSMTGLELVRQVRQFAPHSVVAAHIEDSSGVTNMLEAGALAVFTRRVPPGLIAEQVTDYLRSSATSPLCIV